MEHRGLGVRAVGVAVILALVVAIAATLSPSVREQVELSFLRKDDPYVELSFPDFSAERSCLLESGSVTVQFALRRSGPSMRAEYEVAVFRAERVYDFSANTVRVASGQTVELAERVAAPEAGRFEIEVTSGNAQLRLHCEGEA